VLAGCTYTGEVLGIAVSGARAGILCIPVLTWWGLWRRRFGISSRGRKKILIFINRSEF